MPRSRNPQDWDLGCLEATGWTQESLAFLDAAVQLLHVRGAVYRCTVLLEHKVVSYQTLCVSLAAIWRREAASKKLGTNITRISCFVTTMKLPHALQIYSAVFVKKCISCVFQGSAITNYRWSGKFNYILWADNFCLQQWKNYYKSSATAEDGRPYESS